jgi:hypothetical protein
VGHNLPGPQPRLSEKAKGDLDPCNHDLVMAGPSFTPRRLPIYIVYSDGRNQPREKDMRSHTHKKIDLNISEESKK